MKKYILYIGCLLMFSSMFSCEDFLDKESLDKPENDYYWVDETSLRSYSQGYYLTYFTGYAQDYRAFGGFYSGDSYTDDFLLTSENSTDINQRYFFPQSSTTGINSASVWSDHYVIIRKANVMLEKIPGMSLNDDERAHWTGIARFFRAMAYSALVKTYGGVPYLDVAPGPDDDEVLYQDRADYVTVTNKILEDFDFALKNVRLNDKTLQVNRYVVGAYMSRSMLYHATWLKYHGTTVGPTSKPVDNATLSKFFQGAIDGAKVVMDSGKFGIGNTYNALFTSDVLAGNPEVVFYREYTTGLFCNALMAYNAKEDQRLGGATIDALESYLCIDGLPVGQSPSYAGATDPSPKNLFKDRDPRLYDTFVDSLRILNSGIHAASSPTGFVAKKFLNEAWLAENSPYVTGLNSPADAPIMRYAEVLLNYVEARYEISTVGGPAFTQEDLDKTINVIRSRALTKWAENPSVPRQMPALTLSGDNVAVGGTVINDPARDPDVKPILWEIRRERRVELMLEGRRSDDLNRWAKFEYLNTGDVTAPTKTSLGAWIKKSDYPGIKSSGYKDGKVDLGVNLYNPNGSSTTEGYISYYYFDDPVIGASKTSPRVFKKGELDSERMYLRAIPSGQITIYKDKGYTLTQNPGW